MTYTEPTLADLRKRVRDRLLEVGHVEIVAPDDYYAGQLREAAYAWGRNHNYQVSTSVKDHPTELIKRVFTAIAVAEEEDNT